jgi:hypothetical protein
MKLCSSQVDLCVPDDLSEAEQDRLLETIDALRLPYRLRRCVTATLDQSLDRHRLTVRVEP